MSHSWLERPQVVEFSYKYTVHLVTRFRFTPLSLTDHVTRTPYSNFFRVPLPSAVRSVSAALNELHS